LEGRNWRRQPETIFIVTLLDGGSQDALDSYSVAAHDRRNFFAIFVEHPGSHRLRILIAQLEHVADLHRSVNTQRSAAIRAGFTRSHIAQVDVHRRLKVAARG